MNTQTDQLPQAEAQRKLATVQIVATVQPHPNSEHLQIVSFEHCMWQAVTATKYAIGDAVALFESDSVFSSAAVQEAAGLPPQVNRIKPVKLRGVRSSVYVCPAEALAKYIGSNATELLGKDLSPLLGITKYMQPDKGKVSTSGQQLPSSQCLFATGLVPKTEQLRLQSYPELLEQVCCGEWYATAKLDGTSTTYGYKDGVFYTAGRNYCLTDTANVYARFANKVGLGYAMQLLGRNLAVQGELCGPKIQGNPLQLTELSFYVFRVWDIDAKQPLPLLEATQVAKQLGLDFVTVVAHGDGLTYSAADFVQLADSQLWPSGKPGEGIVVSNSTNTVTFKVISALSRT